jgi:small GTP-binding protein
MLVDEGSIVFRVVLIGDSSVGKTCVVNRFLHDSFDNHEPNTIGASYETYIENRDGFAMELQIWDTAGQEKYKSLGPIYYRESAAALAVFDMSNHGSFESIPGWIKSFRSVSGEAAIVIVVGNKMDLVDEQVVQIEEAQHWAQVEGLDFLPASAKTGSGVREVFDKLLDRLAEKRDSFQAKDSASVPPLEPSLPEPKSTCC